MRRRRRFGRPLRRMFRPLRRRRSGPIARAALGRLRQAHSLREEGDYDGAARIFEELAEVARARSHPQAARLTLSAGRAWIAADETDRGMDLLKAGLALLAGQVAPDRLQHIYARVITELRAQGLAQEADTIDASMRESGFQLRPKAAGQLPGILPAKCPQCGGSVRSDEIEWIGVHQAICDYCGSTLQP